MPYIWWICFVAVKLNSWIQCSSAVKVPLVVLYLFMICIKQDIEYIRSHYNIEDFIYFNHHRREEHGHLHHYALNPIFKLFSKVFLKVQSFVIDVAVLDTRWFHKMLQKYLYLFEVVLQKFSVNTLIVLRFLFVSVCC